MLSQFFCLYRCLFLLVCDRRFVLDPIRDHMASGSSPRKRLLLTGRWGPGRYTGGWADCRELSSRADSRSLTLRR